MAVGARTNRVVLGAGPLLLVAQPVGSGAPSIDGRAGDAAALDHGGVVGLIDVSAQTPDDAARLVESTATSWGGAAALGVVGGSIAATVAAVDAGAGLVVVDTSGESPAEPALAVARRGALVVLTGADAMASIAVADTLAADGIAPDRIVVEIGPYADPAARAESHLGPDSLVAAVEHAAYGFRVGAALAEPESHGWSDGAEIGALTELLLCGVATVRGPSVERFRRVLAVVSAVQGARRQVTDRPGAATSSRSPGGSPS